MYLFSILQMRLFMKNDDTNSIIPKNDEVVFSVQECFKRELTN